jgi:hypothetical protein
MKSRHIHGQQTRIQLERGGRVAAQARPGLGGSPARGPGPPRLPMNLRGAPPTPGRCGVQLRTAAVSEEGIAERILRLGLSVSSSANQEPPRAFSVDCSAHSPYRVPSHTLRHIPQTEPPHPFAAPLQPHPGPAGRQRARAAPPALLPMSKRQAFIQRCSFSSSVSLQAPAAASAHGPPARPRSQARALIHPQQGHRGPDAGVRWCGVRWGGRGGMGWG